MAIVYDYAAIAARAAQLQALKQEEFEPYHAAVKSGPPLTLTPREAYVRQVQQLQQVLPIPSGFHF